MTDRNVKEMRTVETFRHFLYKHNILPTYPFCLKLLPYPGSGYILFFIFKHDMLQTSFKSYSDNGVLTRAVYCFCFIYTKTLADVRIDQHAQQGFSKLL